MVRDAVPAGGRTGKPGRRARGWPHWKPRSVRPGSRRVSCCRPRGQGAGPDMGLIKKVLRAAVAQPWEYVGEGAPDDWEFRVSPDEGPFAVYDRRRDIWVMLASVRLSAVGVRR